jgi:protein O-GlcNAc transferase
MHTLDPAFAPAFRSLEDALRCEREGRMAEAERLFTRLAKKYPDYFDAIHFFALFRFRQGKLNDALALLTKAIKIHPGSARVHNSHGAVLSRLGRRADAVLAYRRSLAIDARNLDALINCGNSLALLGRRDEAIACYDQVLALQPDDLAALTGRSNMLLAAGRLDAALSGYDRALALEPNHIEALMNRATLCLHLERYADAIGNFERVAAIHPNHPRAFSASLEIALAACDWKRADRLRAQALERVGRGAPVDPFLMLLCSDDAALHLRCATTYLRSVVPELPKPLWRGRRYSHDRIRLAYLSADFGTHATARLTAELFERHDRARFEIIAASYGPDDGSAMRARLVRAFDRFHDVRAASDREVAELLHDGKVDIAIDLNGYTTNSRPGILAHRPAPIQAAFLGYPGTTAAPFIDYIIADKIVLPFDRQAFYAERIVQLPHSYQVNDAKTEIAERTPTRAECGLPDDAFVFCCFNNRNKISGAMFDRWCRLLEARTGSVLWLLGGNGEGKSNICREAKARGLDPCRFIFGQRLPSPQHLARHRLADLFLDTLPYNAHTTASDALWAGLPVLTCTGSAFAGRVATSLLVAVGLPELVTSSLDEYEALALRLAADAPLLGELRAKLARNLPHCWLFDSDRFRQDIEGAYATMWEIGRRGGVPESFVVGPG